MSNELKVAHCPKCGSIFQKNLRNLCSQCSDEEDAQLRSIETALGRNRKLSNAELAAATGLSESAIRAYIRSGKLRLYEYPELFDRCDSCAGPIRRGTICKPCANRIQDEIAHVLDQERKLKERIQLKTYIAKS